MTKKIIVIVKNPEIKKVIKKILIDSSYEIYYFEEIREALDIIYDEVPDLVLIEAVNNPFVEVSIINDLKSDPLFVS